MQYIDVYKLLRARKYLRVLDIFFEKSVVVEFQSISSPRFHFCCIAESHPMQRIDWLSIFTSRFYPKYSLHLRPRDFYLYRG